MRTPSHCAVLLALALGCGDDGGGFADGGLACDTDDCDDPTPGRFACQDVLDARGPGDPAFLEGLSDVFARAVLKRPGTCPRSLSEMVAKLRLEDDDRCEDDPRTGMLGRIVSERAQLLVDPDVVRAVVGRQCGQRLPYELLYTTPNIDADNPELPQTDIGVIAFDRLSGAFNFYGLEGRGEGARWVFHGDSFDQIDPAVRENSACSSCHSDGGLVMREIDAPWVHWESANVRTVGAGIVTDRFTELGARSSGTELSEVVRAGNQHWNRNRIDAFSNPDRVDLHRGSTRALLEPLFCGTSLNLQSAAGPSEIGNPRRVDAVPSSFFVDPLFVPDAVVHIDADAYEGALSEIGSRIEGLVGPKDTFFGFTFVERAAADLDYVQALIDRGLIDEEFALDVLSVDFTAPVYSLTRCALLEYAPSFDALGAFEDPPDEAEPVTSCCVAHGRAGCEDDAVEACVCEEDDYCCATAWDQGCVNVVIDGGCGTCAGLAKNRDLSGPPQSTADRPDPVALRNAFHAALQGVQGAGAQALRDALATGNQVQAHRDRAARFVQACADRASARDREGFVHDLLEVSAWKRREAMAATALLDTPGAVAVDDLAPPMDLRWDPVRCELD